MNYFPLSFIQNESDRFAASLMATRWTKYRGYDLKYGCDDKKCWAYCGISWVTSKSVDPLKSNGYMFMNYSCFV